jgi:predicted amidohydrolase YtcJ
MRVLSRRLLALMALTALSALLTGCGPSPEPADLVLLNGRVVTLDPALPSVQALAARGDTIAAVGSDDEVGKLVGPRTRVIDLEGRLAIPGFIEGHAHFVSLGQSKRILDLRTARNWDEIVARVEAAARTAPPGAWILGRGWHQEKWASRPSPAVAGYPVKDALDRVAPGHPVRLRHASGHASIVNALALERAGIGPASPDPPGGTIVRDRAGRPTGVLIEAADDAVQNAVDADRARRPAAEADAELRRDVELATDECLSKGITTFHDAGEDLKTVDRLRGMAEAGELRLRLYVMLSDTDEIIAPRLREGPLIEIGHRHLTVRAIKRYMDGALGSHGAWMLAPYADLKESTGLPAEPVAQLEATARLAAENGFQLCVHAIGDRGNREVLDVYDRTFRAFPALKDPRWRIEHAQHLDPADVPRFARLGVIAAMQGIHCTSDGPWVAERIGVERARTGAYAWRRLLDSGALVINGTDAPVEDVDPIACFHASATRKMKDGAAFFPEQRMTREEALRSYTASAAYAGFEEGIKGTLTPGKLADVVVLSRDILAVPDDEIRSARVLFTIVGGRVAYRAEEAR